MSLYPFTALPCQICNIFDCATPEDPGHDSPVMIALAHATGAAAIRRVLLKVDRPDFVSCYEAEDRGPVSPRCAGLLRALDDAAALVGECGEYRPDVKFVLPVRKEGAVVLFPAQRSIDQ